MSSAQLKKQVSLYNDIVPVISTLNAVLQWKTQVIKLKKDKNYKNLYIPVFPTESHFNSGGRCPAGVP